MREKRERRRRERKSRDFLGIKLPGSEDYSSSQSATTWPQGLRQLTQRSDYSHTACLSGDCSKCRYTKAMLVVSPEVLLLQILFQCFKHRRPWRHNCLFLPHPYLPPLVPPDPLHPPLPNVLLPITPLPTLLLFLLLFILFILLHFLVFFLLLLKLLPLLTPPLSSTFTLPPPPFSPLPHFFPLTFLFTLTLSLAFSLSQLLYTQQHVSHARLKFSLQLVWKSFFSSTC